MRSETSRKLVLIYLPRDGAKNHSVEMKVSKEPRLGRIFGGTNYTEYLEVICRVLNEEIAKLVDSAQFHIVEVTTIK